MTEFQKIYENNYRSVYYYIHHLCNHEMLAQDLTQETFYHVLLYICDGKNVTICKSWLIRVAHNVFIDYIRKNKMNINTTLFTEEVEGHTSFDSVEKLDLINLLNKLPVRYRSLIILKDHYGFSYEEMAEIMNCPQTAIKVTLFRARKNLEALYGKYERDSESL